jgi:superkiller protein 3
MKTLPLLLLLAWPGAAFAASLLHPLRQSELKDSQRRYAMGDYQGVIEGLSPAAMQKLHPEDLALAYFYLGGSYERLGKLDRALGVYQLGVKLFPNDASLLTKLASLLHDTDLEEEARPLYEKVLQLEPDNAEAHKGLAEIDRALGLLDRSAEHYEKALETFGDQAGLWRDYAEVLLDQRDARTAELALRRALELAPEADSWIDLGFSLRAQGRIDDALSALDKAALLAPGNAGVMRTRALWLLEAGRTKDALAQAEAILGASPDDPLARWIRGSIRLSSGQEAAAAADFEAAAGAEREAPFTSRLSAALLEAMEEER